MTERPGNPIGLSTLRRYLEDSGWQRAPSDRTAFDLFWIGKGRARVEVLLPRVGVSKDPSRWVAAALRTVSQIQGTDVSDLSETVRTAGRDVLRSKVPDDIVENDTIALGVADGFLQHLTRLFLAGATTELNPLPFFPRVLKEAKSYALACRFAHTFRGSFGFTIESPIPERTENQPLGLPSIPPYERRVMERLARGLNMLKRAQTSGDVNALVEDFGAGLSANMCEQIIALAEMTDGAGVEFDFSFSELRPSTMNRAELRTTRVSTSEVELLRAAVNSMRTERAPRPVELEGPVVVLRATGVPADLDDFSSRREVTLDASIEGGSRQEVRITLGPVEYLAALQAHAEGRPLRFEGRLELVGRSLFLLDAKPRGQFEMFEVQRVTRSLPKPE